jgi:hypothetical protein
MGKGRVAVVFIVFPLFFILRSGCSELIRTFPFVIKLILFQHD